MKNETYTNNKINENEIEINEIEIIASLRRMAAAEQRPAHKEAILATIANIAVWGVGGVRYL
jgi:hypothetical protein